MRRSWITVVAALWMLLLVPLAAQSPAPAHDAGSVLAALRLAANARAETRLPLSVG